MKRISLIGATGSIGVQTCDVIEQHPDLFELEAYAFGTNVDVAEEWINRLRPKYVSAKDIEVLEQLKPRLTYEPLFFIGPEGLIECATAERADVVVTAVVGAVGLEPTLAAIEAGKDIALANKETLVTAGHLVTAAVKKHGVNLLPVDSEHSAIYQCLNGERREDVSKIILTASGGSFRDKSREELEGVTVAEALAHPNWSMGAKITIDSATMFNKGLEVIEAHWLFDIDYNDIEVVLHRESIIHSMVEFKDAAVMAQLGNPDMRGPILYALSGPKRLEIEGNKRLNLREIGTLHFAEADLTRYPALRLAYEAGRAGGSMPTVLNAANEAAVELFLNGEIAFLDIERIVEQAMETHTVIAEPTLEEILQIDRAVREQIQQGK
ncbi:1-deoxy-D-xylulose-5-phosphate reductoisomerase [Exiguobacterium sp. AM39-5BH]|uniref:1-deoxy-D-xylulose-5-phosphate reductoisomerase n=1 Tax=Exiguobacterium sp. AM39-5BH TaxID=2292355 RepID=UPI000FE1CCCD|nr:1-deoxy-D-xylulose-5-phosphate reductoisomerase [Exiguobacterium sp. AM39-5BH]RHB51108.1 1-deoxy-D-xylulose-5-phosphate reductoisomerase [Exiguobacterium sp. AM39-5BH]